MPKFQPSITVRVFGDDLIACIVDIEHTWNAQRRLASAADTRHGKRAAGGHGRTQCMVVWINVYAKSFGELSHIHSDSSFLLALETKRWGHGCR